jgi:hypothetical protein
MEPDEKEPKPLLEDIIITLACVLQLRQTKLELEELLFIEKEVVNAIKNYERNVH